jgi:hypothetical protein
VVDQVSVRGPKSRAKSPAASPKNSSNNQASPQK